MSVSTVSSKQEVKFVKFMATLRSADKDWFTKFRKDKPRRGRPKETEDE